MGETMERGLEVRRIVAGSLLAAGAVLGGAACGSQGEIVRVNPSTEGIDLTDLTEATPAVDVTDADLRRDDISEYNCGGKLRPEDQPAGEFSADYWIDYANDNPELGPKLMNFYDFALGTDAVDVLLEDGITNILTSDNKTIESDERANTLAHKLTTLQLQSARTYANYSCMRGDKVDIHRATNKPTINVLAGNHLEGIILDQAGVERFMSAVNKYADGSTVADIIPVQGNEGSKDPLYVVVMKAFGCDNPLTKTAPAKPGITTTVVSTPPTLPPMTVPVPRDKVPVPRTHDAHPQKGAGGSPENGDDPQNDSNENGYGPGDTPTVTVRRTPHTQESLPTDLPPASTGAPRVPAPSVPATTEDPRPRVTSPELGD